MQNGLYDQPYQCKAKCDVRLLTQKLISIGLYCLFFKFINQRITKSSETNLVYFD